MNCELCANTSEMLLWRGQYCRVILVENAEYPGFCRVIWNEHVKEMTDLMPQMRSELMDTVFAVESAVREVMQPDKINLASLGNVVPHLHWHVIPRYTDDTHFPNPIWATQLRNPRTQDNKDLQIRLSKSILNNLSR